MRFAHHFLIYAGEAPSIDWHSPSTFREHAKVWGSATRCLSRTIQHLPCDNFKIAFRLPMSSAHVSAVQADNHFFTRFVDRRSHEGLSGLFKPLSDLHSAVAYCTDCRLC
jgi:hypothetical protein